MRVANLQVLKIALNAKDILLILTKTTVSPQEEEKKIETEEQIYTSDFMKENEIKCKSDLLNFCDSCDMQFEKISLYQTPKCLNHYFCSSCLKKATEKDLDDCMNCKAYFKVIGKRNNSKFCALCTSKSVKQLISCSIHGYCEHCYDFITKFHCTEFGNIYACQECKNSIEVLKVSNPEEHKIPTQHQNEVITCELGDSFHKYQILINEFDVDKVKSCKACIKLFLALKDIKVCVFCKKQLDLIDKFTCKEYRNICEECYISVVQPKHVITCVKCQKTHKSLIKECDYCHEYEISSNLFRVPRCNEHYFCVDCLSEEKPTPEEFCSSCVSYFDAIGKTFETGCNICSLYADSYQPICDKHHYCKICLNFIICNDYSKFSNLTNCIACSAGIEQLKIRAISSTSENISNPDGLCGMNSYSISPQEIKSPTYQSDYNASAWLYPLPHQDLQIYPNQSLNPVHSSAHPIVYQTSGYQYPPHYQDSFYELPQTSTTDTPAYPVENTTNHGELENFLGTEQAYYRQSLSGSILTKPHADIGNLPETSLCYNSALDLSVFCHNCRNPRVYCVLPCDHNCCEECLAFSCSMKIYQFFKEYERNPKAIESRFRYKCPVEGCNRVIDIPTAMVVRISEEIVARKEGLFNRGKFIENEVNLNYVLRGMDIWVPYFDGIKPFIVSRLFRNR